MRIKEKIRGLWTRFLGGDHEFISVVLFLSRPRTLSKIALNQAAARVWNRVSTSNSTTDFVVVKGPVILVQARGHLLNVLNAARPYISDKEGFVKTIMNIEVSEAVLRHNAWLSVDYISSGKGRDIPVDARYRAAARLTAELVEDDCLAVCFPDKEVVVPVSSNTAELLRNFSSVEHFVERSQHQIHNGEADMNESSRKLDVK
jgi:hypothetical protein